MSFVRTGHVLGGRYTLVAPIASGGMGDVWSASDDVLGREVAVKLLRNAGDEGFLDRFRDEARSSASLHHPNIATVFDYGEDADAPYLVMELVPGDTLSSLIATSSGDGLDVDQVRSIVGQAALALAAAHEAGVVHRDVKPANIIVTPDGQAKLTDFGIARLGDGSGHTITGEVLGTPEYISPEQALGEPATSASDLYSLGVIAHEMLTGAKPFDAGSPVATAVAQVNDEPPPLPLTVPVDLRSVVESCLVKAPEERLSDARAVAQTLLDPPGGMPLSSLPAHAGLVASPAPTALFATPASAEPLTPGDPIVPEEPLTPVEPLTLGGPAAHSSGPVGPATRALPVSPAHLQRRSDARGRAQRHTASRRVPRWGWLAAPLVGVLVWGAFALGSLIAGGDRAAPTQGSIVTPSVVAPATPSPTSVTPTTTQATSTAPKTVQSEPADTPGPTEVSPTHPGKGNGRGKGNK